MPVPPTFMTSTGEDHPDEWPVEGWRLAGLLAAEWSPSGRALRTGAALALMGVLLWARPETDGSAPRLATYAPEPAAAARTGSTSLSFRPTLEAD